MKKYNYRKLRGLIVEKYITLSNFANALGIGTTTLNSRLHGKTYFNQIEIEKAVDLLKLEKNEINNIFLQNCNGYSLDKEEEIWLRKYGLQLMK